MGKPEVGEKAPDFELNNQNGKLIKSTDFQGTKLVLFFYPKASTPGCTAQACSLRDSYAELQKKGYVLLGISPDPESRLKKFQEKFEFPFDLLSDPEHIMLKDYGVWGPKKFMGKEYEGVLRTTYIVDEAGKIARVIDRVKTKEHAEQILEG